MPFSAPTGFMAPPRPGVFVVVSCSGTPDQGSLFHLIQDPSNYSVVVAFWIFVVCKIYMCRVIGVRCCKAWAIHPVFKKHVFSFSDTRFVIRAIYIPCLFQPLPRWSPITRGIPSTIRWDNYTLYANAVGRSHVSYPPSMNPVGVVT